ncbi:hypothetical protein ACFYUY_38520 [Kitasatospora sp. NPDC004745]|uniref:hypothetical protein n=1 Tax=unclassified Kitasatospora TaxID=2633591 RepID=UPI0033C08A1C
MPRPEETARRLGIVCAREQELGARLRAGPLRSDALVRDLLEAVRQGEDVADRVDALHNVLVAVGVPQGLYAYDEHGRTGDRGVHVAGADRGRSAEPVYLCPLGPAARCGRFWWQQGPVPVPRCAVSGDALCRERL